MNVLTKSFSFMGHMIQYGCVGHCVFNYVIDIVQCQGPSMEPTIFTDDIIITEHISPAANKIDVGDVIIAKCPSNPNQNICKRVIALPGDKVRTGFASTTIVPIGHIWLEGDNKYNSCDSRAYGPVPMGLVKSRAVYKIWPLNNISPIK